MAARTTTLTVWRSGIALSGLTGVWLAALRYDVWWTALSQLASMAVAAAYTWFAAYPHLTGRPEPESPWLRGGLATLMVLVGGAYLVMTSGDLTAAYSLFEHLVTPMLVLVDFLVVGANQHAIRWWHPLTWLVPPAAYLVWYVVGDLRVYVALDPARRTEFMVEVLMLSAFVLATGLLLRAVTSGSCNSSSATVPAISPGWPVTASPGPRQRVGSPPPSTASRSPVT